MRGRSKVKDLVMSLIKHVGSLGELLLFGPKTISGMRVTEDVE